MVRKIEVIVPVSQAENISKVLVLNRSVHHLSVFPGHVCVKFTFKIVNKQTQALLEVLSRWGVGNRYGTIDIVNLTSTKPRISTFRSRTGSYSGASVSSSNLKIKRKKLKEYGISDRMAFDEIFDTIDNQLHLTFDYLFLIIIAAIISAVGLLTDSSVSVVASMLVSPLMGPILGVTFGWVIKDRLMFWKGLRNEIIGVLVCFFTGCVVGLVAGPFHEPYHRNLAYGENTQMSSRGSPWGLIWGALVAIPSGLGVALGVTSNQVSALIGVAISAALLPPVTNSGLTFSLALIFYFQDHDRHVTRHYVICGIVSMVLFLMNWALIFVFGTVTFRIKRLNESAREHERMKKLDTFNRELEKVEREKKLSIDTPPAGDTFGGGPLMDDLEAGYNPNSSSNLFDDPNKLRKMGHKSMMSTPLLDGDFLVKSPHLSLPIPEKEESSPSIPISTQGQNQQSLQQPQIYMGSAGHLAFAHLNVVPESSPNDSSPYVSPNDGKKSGIGYYSPVSVPLTKMESEPRPLSTDPLTKKKKKKARRSSLDASSLMPQPRKQSD